MREEFLKKFENQEYISNYLYLRILENYQEVIPNDFDIDKYNEEVTSRLAIKYHEYFANMYKGIDDGIKLDDKQIKAILADEDYSLIIAGAGTGKTTTMASKVKYLVDIKGVNPEEIVVMSFTKKATQELEARIVGDFGIPAYVTTFHSLGYKYIREIFNNRKCYVVDGNVQNQIFLDYFKKYIFPFKDRVKEIIKIFDQKLLAKKWIFGAFFKNNYHKFDNFDEYFEEYKKYKLSEVIDLEKEVKERVEKQVNQEEVYTIKKELVKSKGEAIIANFLFCNGIDYKYEKIYPELMNDNKVYHPDFTLELGGEEIYLEYFGLSNYADTEYGKYEKLRKMKEEYHRMHHTKFIKLDYAPRQDLLKTLKEELIKMGFTLRPKSNEEIFKALLDNNVESQFFMFRDFMFDVIRTIKASSKRKNYKNVIKDYLNGFSGNELYQMERQFFYIDEFYHYYQKCLFDADNYGFDFSDMIYYANMYIDSLGVNNKLNFKYIVIDEYQDISQERYEFTKNIALKNKAKVVAVGDDWQSIYAFSGSRIDYIYNFQKYFKGAKLFEINKTYRNSQELINYSGEFIMRNKDQIRKDLVSDKSLFGPIKFVLFQENEEYAVLKRLILKINAENPMHKIMILARNNSMIDACFLDDELKDAVDTKIEFVGYEDIDIDGMTIHKSKGLSSDEVIVIGLNENFPNSNIGEFWLKKLFKQKVLDEAIPFAEERRIFYVALTRTRNNVYLLVNENPKLRSSFVNEIYRIVKDNFSVYN